MADNFTIKDFLSGDEVIIRSTEDTSVHKPHHIAENAASENHIGEVGAARDIIDVPLVTSATTYTTGTVLCDTATIADAVRVNAGKGELVSLTLLDKADQGAKIDFVFFKITHSLGTKNVAPAISDADAADILGVVTVDTADYIDLGGAKLATKRGIGLMIEANTGVQDIFVSAIVTGTPTYGAADLFLKLGVEQS